MIILKDNDNVFCDTIGIHFTIDDKEVTFDISQIEKVSIITTDRGPFEDDVALAVFIGEEIFLIKSMHKSYSELIFKGLGKVITLDYDMIIESSTSVENAQFIIFEK